jgi:hypothetical protein
MRLSQIELVAAIGEHIARKAEEQGLKDPPMISRQMNAVIEAADLIVEAFAEDFRPSKPGAGLMGWLASDETGLSSREMARRLAPLAFGSGAVRVPGESSIFRGPNYPHDPSDLGRCVSLLDAAPELREHLPSMADVCPEWAALVGAWDELEALYREELPSGRAPKCYARMRQLIDAARFPEPVS